MGRDTPFPISCGPYRAFDWGVIERDISIGPPLGDADSGGGPLRGLGWAPVRTVSISSVESVPPSKGGSFGIFSSKGGGAIYTCVVLGWPRMIF